MSQRFLCQRKSSTVPVVCSARDYLSQTTIHFQNCAFNEEAWNINTHWAHSTFSDRAAWLRRLIWVFVTRTSFCIFVVPPLTVLALSAWGRMNDDYTYNNNKHILIIGSVKIYISWLRMRRLICAFVVRIGQKQTRLICELIISKQHFYCLETNASKWGVCHWNANFRIFKFISTPPNPTGFGQRYFVLYTDVKKKCFSHILHAILHATWYK